MIAWGYILSFPVDYNTTVRLYELWVCDKSVNLRNFERVSVCGSFQGIVDWH